MTAEIIQLAPRRNEAPSKDSPEDPWAHEADMSAGAATTICNELRRARIRILQLESSLTAALRDSVRHHDRALGAERRLEALERLLSASDDGGARPA